MTSIRAVGALRLPDLVDLKTSYRACRLVAARSRSSFYWAFSLLPLNQRRGIEALYAFARIVDDWADDEAETVIQASFWRSFIEEREFIQSIDIVDGEVIHQYHYNPSGLFHALGGIFSTKFRSLGLESHLLDLGIHPAVQDTIRRFEIPKQYLLDLVNRAADDRESNLHIHDLSDLENYCYGVASTIGLSCIRIWGGDEKATYEAAVACGHAFQFTNIVRDLREDAARGRIYIPQEWLTEFSVDTKSWHEGRPTGDWKEPILRLVGTARERYEIGWKVFDSLDASGQRMFSLIWHNYRKLLDELAGNLDAVWQGRVRLSRATKLKLYARHAFTPWFVGLSRKRGD